MARYRASSLPAGTYCPFWQRPYSPANTKASRSKNRTSRRCIAFIDAAGCLAWECRSEHDAS